MTLTLQGKLIHLLLSCCRGLVHGGEGVHHAHRQQKHPAHQGFSAGCSWPGSNPRGKNQSRIQSSRNTRSDPPGRRKHYPGSNSRNKIRTRPQNICTKFFFCQHKNFYIWDSVFWSDLDLVFEMKSVPNPYPAFKIWIWIQILKLVRSGSGSGLNIMGWNPVKLNFSRSIF